MEVKNLYILIILAANSLLFSCADKSNGNADFHLSLSETNGSGYLCTYNFDEDIKIISRDTLNLNYLCSKSSNVDNQIINGKYLNSCGVFDLNKKQSTSFSDFIPLGVEDNLITLYDPRERNILEYNLNSNTFKKNTKIDDFDFQLFNNKVAFDFLSGDYGKIIVLKKDENDRYKIYVKYLATLREEKLVEDVSGNIIDKSSNAMSVPSVIWVDNNNFLFTNYLKKADKIICEITKFDISTRIKTNIGVVTNIEMSKVNNKFTRGTNQDIYLRIEDTFYKVDLKQSTIKESAYDVGNNFKLASVGSFFEIIHNDKKIGEIPKSSTFEINKRQIRTSKNKIVLFYKLRIDGVNPSWQKKCTVWSEKTEKWTDIETENFSEIIDFK